MIKLFVGMAIVAFSSFCGYKLAGKYRRKKNFFAQFSAFNERFLGELAYYRRPIRQFIAEYTYQGEFRLLLEEFVSGLNTGADRANLLTLDEEFSFLNKDEQHITQEYFMTIGKGDSASQKAYFFSMKERINALRDSSETECKRYADLYVKLGFLFGLFILILML